MLADQRSWDKSSSSVFVVYAHGSPNNKKHPANDQSAVILIESLKQLRYPVFSDKSPFSPMPFRDREEKTNAVRDILANQFCLLPEVGSSSDGSMGSVDKVIICGSSLLEMYLIGEKDNDNNNTKGLAAKFASQYIQEIKDIYVKHSCNGWPNVKKHIETFVNTQCSKDYFHHILTEIAFLRVRSEKKGNASIIPISLNGVELMAYIPFLRGTDLRLKCSNIHLTFFKLLKLLSLSPFLQGIVDTFRSVYETSTKELPNNTLLNRQQIEFTVRSNLSRAQVEDLKYLSAVSRDIHYDEHLVGWAKNSKIPNMYTCSDC